MNKEAALPRMDLPTPLRNPDNGVAITLRSKTPPPTPDDVSEEGPSSTPSEITPPHTTPPKPPKITTFLQKLSPKKLIVSAYKIFGFIILTAILVGLAAYVSLHLFFLASNKWCAPVILSSTDGRVLQFVSRYARESAGRDALITRKHELESNYAHAVRSVETELRFQEAYKAALEEDLKLRKSELSRFRSLRSSYSKAQQQIEESRDAFRDASKERLKEEYYAGVIDKDHMLAGQNQLAQIAEANLSLETRRVELDTRIKSLHYTSSALASALSTNNKAKRRLSYDALRIRQEFDRSVLAAQKADDDKKVALNAIKMTEKTIGDYDKLLKDMEESPYLRTSDEDLVVAFVPYDNVGSAYPGTPVYTCALGFLWCRSIGKVGKTFDGEIAQKHPMLQRELRGIIVALDLEDPKGAESGVLHLGRKPLWL